MDNATIRAALASHGIDQPLPSETITNARWIARLDEWWVHIDRWYWWDKQSRTWKASANGPS